MLALLHPLCGGAALTFFEHTEEGGTLEATLLTEGMDGELLGEALVGGHLLEAL